MRLYDDVRDSVVYLGFPRAGHEGMLDAEGTGFLVSYTGHGDYIVSAAHVAKVLEGVPFGVRLNDKQDRARVEHVDEVKWWYHPDTTVDVAVMEYMPPPWAKTSPWIARWFISDFKRETKDIGAGDLAYIVGMYHYLPGTTKNIPIVHTGHLAMMAERIPAKDWRAADPDKAAPIEIEGFLVEAQTLEGLSGSPVFVRRSIHAMVEIPDLQQTPVNVWWHGSLWCLGLWHGAWYGEPTKEKRIRRTGPVKVPAGMGVVIPAQKILDVLNRPELVAKRSAADANEKMMRALETSSSSTGAITAKVLATRPLPRKKSAVRRVKPK